MVWFSCEDCGDTVKKPKLANHAARCSAFALTCVDCQSTFEFTQAHSHDRCFTEHEKYALAKASHNLQPNTASSPHSTRSAQPSQRRIEGEKYLASKPPWKCFLCNITCTSLDTLRGHAAGKRHISKARAAERRSKSWSELALDVLEKRKQSRLGLRLACLDAAKLAAGGSASAEEIDRLRKQCKCALKEAQKVGTDSDAAQALCVEAAGPATSRGKRRKVVVRHKGNDNTLANEKEKKMTQ